jgi:lipase
MTDTENYRQRTVPVAGGDLAVGSWGPQDAPVVLAVHGVTASHRCWPLVAGQLTGLHIIAPDLRGRGRSNTLPGPFGMAQHADDLARVLDDFGVDRALVLGHSMGAFASVVLADRHPSRVSGLVLVDGGLPLTVPEGMSSAEFTRAVLGPAADRLSMTFASRQEYAQFWKVHPAFAGAWNDTVADYIDYDLTGDEGRWRASTAYQAVAEDSAELNGSDAVIHALESLAHPTMFLRAPRGLQNEPRALYSPEDVARWRRRVPGLAVREVDAVNHYTIVMSDRGAAAVAAAVLDTIELSALQDAVAQKEATQRS